MAANRDRVTRAPEALMLGVSIAIVIAIAVLSLRSGEATRAANQQRQLSQEIVKLNADLLSTLKDAETGQRGFLLTGDARYLAPYSDAVMETPRLLQRLKNAMGSRADMTSRIRNIDALVAQKLSELKTTIDLRRTGRAAEALTIVETDLGKAWMDQIRAISGEIDRIAQQQQSQSEADAESSASTLRRVSTGGAILMAALLVLATITIFRGMERRDELFRQARAGEKLLATTLAGIADGVIATDANGRVTFINPVALRLTGWNEGDAVGTPITDVFAIVNETTRAKVENPLEKALAQGHAVGLANHTNLISKSGDELPIDDSAAPLKDDAGNTIGAVLVFRDISVRRLAERDLRNANAELQQFVNAAAHDLRSPLNSVNAIAQMLAAQFERELGPRGGELVSYLTDGMGRIRRLLDDLVDFARASHFDQTTARPLSLDVPLQAAIQNLQADIDRAGAEVTFEPLPVVAVHESHAVQVFQNILGNAIKYRGPEAPRVHVSAKRKDSEWLISVADNGMGIDPGYLDQIFRPFKRLHSESAYPGSGIGLAACEKIVKGYGGRIWAESEPGKGSTFFFALPGAEIPASREATV